MTRHRQVGLKKIGINRQILPIFVIDILLQVCQVRCHSPQTFQDLPAQSLKQLALTFQVFYAPNFSQHVYQRKLIRLKTCQEMSKTYQAFQVTQVSNVSTFGVRKKNSIRSFSNTFSVFSASSAFSFSLSNPASQPSRLPSPMEFLYPHFFTIGSVFFIIWPLLFKKKSLVFQPSPGGWFGYTSPGSFFICP